MSKIFTVDELRRSKQPLRPEELIKVAEHYGFRASQGTRHLRFSHGVYVHIFFGVSSDCKGPIPKLRLADAIAETQRLKQLETDKTDKIEDEPDILEDSFEEATGQITIIDDLYLLRRGIHNDTKSYLIRKDYPQIATELVEYNEGDDISDFTDYLASRVEQLKEALIEAEQSGFDIQRFEHTGGRVELRHTLLDNVIVLNPFRPRHGNFTSISAVQNAIKHVQELVKPPRHYDPKELNA